MHYGVAGNTAQTVLRFWCIDLLLDWAVKATIEKYGMVVASRAPFASLRAAQLLHVLDRAAVKAIVEGCEMMHRSLPLLIDVLMAFAAQLGIHEEIGRDETARISASGGGPER